MLTQETLKSLLHYCPDTGIFTRLVRTSSNARTVDVAGNLNKINGYATIKVNRKIYLAHRLAWLYVYGNFPPDELDHINRVKFDNRIENLRIATRSENMQNQSIRSDNKSGNIGVSWHKVTQKWRAQINLHNKNIHLGYFTDLSDAIAARQAAEQHYHPFNSQVTV